MPLLYYLVFSAAHKTAKNKTRSNPPNIRDKVVILFLPRIRLFFAFQRRQHARSSSPSTSNTTRFRGLRTTVGQYSRTHFTEHDMTSTAHTVSRRNKFVNLFFRVKLRLTLRHYCFPTVHSNVSSNDCTLQNKRLFHFHRVKGECRFTFQSIT